MLGGRGAGQHDPEVDAETAHSSAELEEQAKVGMVGVGYRQHPNGRPALGCSLVAISHGPSPQGSLSRGSQPCGIAQTQHLFSSYFHLTETRKAWSNCPINWEYCKVLQTLNSISGSKDQLIWVKGTYY